MFCFPISDQVMLPEGIVSFKCRFNARANVRITNAENKRQIPMRASRGLKWENKTYKLKRSITTVVVPTNMCIYNLEFD